MYRHLWVDMGTRLPGRLGANQEENDLQALTEAWCSKRLSNLDYLLHLNTLAGRRYGDRTFHPFLPWSAPHTPSPVKQVAYTSVTKNVFVRFALCWQQKVASQQNTQSKVVHCHNWHL